MTRTRVRAVAPLLIPLAILGGLTGCTGTVTTPTPTASAVPSASASATAEQAVEYDPGGTASDNLEYFDSVNQTFLAAGLTPGGRPIIDNLVAAGFDKAAMQVTPDTTSIGGTVDAVEFSVRIGTECLVGQASDAGYASTVGPALTGGACLAGSTRAIDW